MAYYGANTAIERSLLVLRYQEAWFEWTGGRNKSNNGSVISDQLSWSFGYYDQNTTLQRTIDWRLFDNSLPGEKAWNLDSYFLSGRLNDRNTLAYRVPQDVPLWVDSTPVAAAYSWDDSRVAFTGTSVAVRFQLTPTIQEKFSQFSPWDGQLAEDIDNSVNWIQDGVVVNWGRKWKYKNDYDSGWSDFSILPRSLLFAASSGNPVTVQESDESVRESDINQMSSDSGFHLLFADRMNPLYHNDFVTELRWETLDTHLLISDNSTWANKVRDMSFQDLLSFSNSSEIRDNILSFSLADTLFSQWWNIYPFLEYKLDVLWWNSKAISQPYFNIQWKSQVGRYTVQINVKKSINKEDSLAGFTVVF